MAEMITTPGSALQIRSRYLPWNGLTGMSTCRTQFGMCVPSKAKFGATSSTGGKVLVASLVLIIGTILAAATIYGD